MQNFKKYNIIKTISKYNINTWVKVLKIDNIEKVGDNIKKIRKGKGITIAELSLYTGLSVGYLSNVERNQTSPTLRNLSIIGNSLETSIEKLIDVTSEEKTLIKREDTIKRHYPEFNMELEIIDFDIEMGIYTYITISPGKTESIADFMHPYSEVCTIIEGELTIIMEEKTYTLNKGDSIYIKPHIEHTMMNKSNEKSISFWHRNHPVMFSK